MAIKKSKSLKKKMAVKKPVAKAGSKTRTPVVCLGASAGGLEAFIQVLGNMPVNTGLAFILVQHLDPKHSSMSAPIISRSTSLPVEEIKDGTVVLPNRVYAIPPNHNLEIANGILKLSPREESGSNMSIDHFMKSLAASEKNRAIGVVLSGTGTDGSAGLWAIKAEGGVTIAQRPNSAKYTGMPESAISAGVVDLVLTPQEITQELVKLSVNPYLTAEEIEDPQERLHTAPAASKEKFPDIQTAFAADGGMHRILSLLFNLTKVDFSGYKHTTIKRRIQRRMVVHKIKSLKAYADFLADHEEEIYALYDDVLINVTEFFRDPEAFAALNKKAFPAIVKNRPPGAPIRVWVPGCSTGEEVYSIAILLLEFLAEHGKHCQIQIFATDISNAAIQMARNGLYPDSISKNVSKERLSLFFEKVESGYKIHKRIRDLCLFSRHDVTCDPPFAKLDLISCRNVLIYFGAGLQKKVLPVFHYGLRAEGFLWLGKSESPGEFSKLFKLVDKTYRLYCKSDLPFPLNFSFRNKISRESHEVIKNPQSFVTAGFDFQKEADKLMLTRFAPPGVIISGDFEVLQFRGRTIPFLEPATGRPTSNLLKMLRPELLGALRASVQKVKKHKRPVLVKDLQFEVEGRILKTELEVLPFNSAANGKGNHFLVLFRAVAKKAVPKASAKGKKVPSGKSVQIGKLNEMQRELSEIKEYQESLIEQYESAQEELTSANEELQSTNEEFQSTNEEFQSTNEELETSQEELQSTNEELITVNDELQIRNSDLSQLSSDLNNLLASIEIPVLIVGSNNRIRMFSPKARSMFNLIQADIGRPISDLKSNLNLDVSAVVAEVSSTLTLIEIEVQDINGSWMRVQVRPYRTVDNRIEGVVISVMDIDLLKQKQIKARELIEYHTSIAEAVPLPLAVVNRRLEFESGNNSFYKYFHANQSAIGKDLFNVLKIHESCLQPLKKALNSALNENQIFTDIEIDCEVPGFGSRKILCSAGKIHWSGPQPDAALISFIDVTEQRLFDKERKYLLQQEQEARLQADSANRSKDIFLATVTHELRTPLASILSWSQLISGGHVNYEKAREGAAVIERSAKIQNQLIDDLLDISRIIVGKLGITIQAVDPVVAIQAAIDSVQPMALKKSVRIIPILSDEAAMIHADPVRLQQVIWNLLTNAIKFSPKESTINIELKYVRSEGRRFAQIKVIDHGKGVAPEFLPHIFTQFSQADSASTRVHGGLGLGLSIVHKLVELHGGSITAENSEAEPGAVFTALFPLVSYHNIAIVSDRPGPKKVADGDAKYQTAPNLDGMRIMVVDDDVSTREAIGIYLRAFGAEVSDVNSAEEAMQLLPKFKPDFIVSDIAMPDEDGYDLIKKIRKLSAEKGGNTPALALTAYSTTEDTKRALNAGFQAHVAKPVDANELGRIIKKISMETAQ